jgi:FAD dependent oxidoreductase
MNNKMTSEYDIIIIGAGTAGSCAAIQSAMGGMKTLLIEKSSLSGGTITASGVDFPGLFHAWGKQIIGGIGWDLVKKCAMETDNPLPYFSLQGLPHWKHQIKINKFHFACLLDEKFSNAGVHVLYHSMTTAVDDCIDGVNVQVATKTGIKKLRAQIVIDCTGDANAVELAGYSLSRNKEKQPGTLMAKFGGYSSEQIDGNEIEKQYLTAVSSGSLKDTDTGMSHSMFNLLLNNGINCIHIPIADASTSEGKSLAEQDGRATVLRVYRFLKKQKGLEKLTIEYMAPECGIRETTVIKGIETITTDDYMTGRHWRDSFCYSFYPIDLHLNTSEGLDKRPLQKGIVPTIPMRALLPAESRSLIVAGRCVSSDQFANSALRVQASCMAMGQGAGAIAVVSCQTKKAPADVDIIAVKNLLKKFNAIIPQLSQTNIAGTKF